MAIDYTKHPDESIQQYNARIAAANPNLPAPGTVSPTGVVNNATPGDQLPALPSGGGAAPSPYQLPDIKPTGNNLVDFANALNAAVEVSRKKRNAAALDIASPGIGISDAGGFADILSALNRSSEGRLSEISKNMKSSEPDIYISNKDNGDIVGINKVTGETVWTSKGTGNVKASTVDSGGAGTIADPMSQSILGATGLSNWAFLLATQGTTALTRLSGPEKTRIGNEWKAYQIAHGIDGATFTSQYQALSKTVEANSLRNNQASVAQSELQATLDNLRSAADDASFKSMRWANIAKMFAGQEFNDPNVTKYAFHLNQLREEFAMYNAALSGQIDTNGNVRDINENDRKVAEDIIRNGIAAGGVDGFERALQASRDKMDEVLTASIETQNDSVWKLFGVQKPSAASRGGIFNNFGNNSSAAAPPSLSGTSFDTFSARAKYNY